MIVVSNGLQLRNVSKRVQQLFDQALSEFLGWFGDPVSTLESIKREDDTCIMAEVLLLAFGLLGTALPFDSDYIVSKVEQVKRLLKTVPHSEQEEAHAKAMIAWADGHYDHSGSILEELLSKHPKDVLALKIAQDSYFYLGNSRMLHQSIKNVINHYDNPLIADQEACTVEDINVRKELYTRGFVLGMYSFGLEEVGLYEEAEECARRGLFINKLDAWSIHGCVHVMEMQGRYREGIKFLSERRQDWTRATALATHLNWHIGLYYIEEGRFDDAISLYDQHIAKSIENEAMLDLVDGASLLYRLMLEEKISRDDFRWQKLRKIYEPHLTNHILVFNDIHMAMCFDVHSNEFSNFYQSWSRYLDRRNKKGDVDVNNKVANEIGRAIIDSVVAYGEQKYNMVYENLQSCSVGFNGSNVVKIGGSHAQRDVIAQLLLNAVVRAPNLIKEAIVLLQQRKIEKPNSGVTQRLMLRALDANK